MNPELDTALKRYQSWSSMHDRITEGTGSDPDKPVRSSDLRNMVSEEIEVSRAVLRFAQTSPPDGPEVTGLRGSGYVLALYRIAHEELSADLEPRLADYTTAINQWFDLHGDLPIHEPTSTPSPQRPRGHIRIQEAMANLLSHLREDSAQKMLDAFAAGGTIAGGDVERHFAVTPGGGTISTASVRFAANDDGATTHAATKSTQPIGAILPPARGQFRHLLQQLHTRWLVEHSLHDRSSSDEPDSAHYRGSTAYRTAHHDRVHVHPGATVNIYRWNRRGWQLRETLSPLVGGHDTTEDGSELIRDQHTAEPVAILRPYRTSWIVLIRSLDDPFAYHEPTDHNDAIHQKHSTAVTSAREQYARKVNNPQNGDD